MSFRVVCAVLATLLISGCGEITLPTGEANATGVIEALNVSASIGSPNILVAHPSGYEGGSRTIFSIENADLAVARQDGSLRRLESSDLKVGQRVKIWTIGVRLNSMPPMMSAVAVEIVADNES